MGKNSQRRRAARAARRPGQPVTEHGPAYVGHEPLPDRGLGRFFRVLDSLNLTVEFLTELVGLTGDPDEAPVVDYSPIHAFAQQALLRLEVQHRWMVAAADMLEGKIPLAARLLDGSYWSGPRTPEQLAVLRLIAAMSPGGEEILYPEALIDPVLRAATARECGRPKRDGQACGNSRVRLADGYRAGACRQHLTAEEADVMKAERAAAMNTTCPGCGAGPQESCVDYRGKPEAIHNRRLRPAFQESAWPKVHLPRAAALPAHDGEEPPWPPGSRTSR